LSEVAFLTVNIHFNNNNTNNNNINSNSPGIYSLYSQQQQQLWHLQKKLQHHRDLQNSRIQKNRKETTEESRSWRKKFSV